MASKKYTVGLSADANDLDDFDVRESAIEHALAKRRARRRVGRHEGSDKERITIRLDHDLLAKFGATEPGWQMRINEALQRAKP